MKIKEGFKYICIKTITVSGDIIYRKGVVYKSDYSDFLLDESRCNRLIASDHLKGYFIKLK